MSYELQNIPILKPTSSTIPTVSPFADIILQNADGSNNNTTKSFEAALDASPISKTRTNVVIGSVTFITALSSMLAGVITVAIPTIAEDVGLGKGLLLWPASIYALVCGCTLLLSGSISDVVGSRTMYLLGCFLQTVFTLACGLARTGPQLIAFRALAGLALSFCLPSSVSIITTTFEEGRLRNIAFSCMGGGQPIGYSLGITLGGIFAGTIGWRWGFYIAAILNAAVFGFAIWALPKPDEGKISWQRIKSDIDWVGAMIASASLALLSYVFATITSSTTSIRAPINIALLSIAVALIPVFIVWVGRREKLHLPALIPNSLWRNKTFTTICLCVILTWGSFNALEQILTFYFQLVQHKTPLQTALQFLPEPASGVLVNVAIGLLVHKIRGDVIVGAATALSCIAPLLMALASPSWSYWAAAFPAMVIVPVGSDSLFTISNLVITAQFPAKTQGLAGGVFNTVSQVGKSVGLALSAVIANSVTQGRSGREEDRLLEGYKATFWFCLSLNLTTLVLGVWGLRTIGKVGLKRD